MKEFLWIGIKERMDESMELLSYQLGLPGLQLSHMNTNPNNVVGPVA